MWSVLLVLTGCNGCQPRLPDPTTDPITGEDDSTTDTDSSPLDTAPALPPRCDRYEVEPNDVSTSVQVIPMESWVCGVLLPADPEHAPLGDVEYLTFSATESGWLEIDVEASQRGSAADMQVVLYDDHDSITVLGSYLSTDPLLRVPLAGPTDYTAILSETSLLFGEDYAWYFLASIVKAPVDWDFAEAEPNNVFSQATPFTPGQTVFGTIDSPGDFDWYHIVTSAKATTIHFTMDAFVHGSPVDGQILLYAADGTTLLRDDRAGEIEYDLDPYFTYRQTGSNDWYMLVRNELERGNHFHWYTVSIEETVD